MEWEFFTHSLQSQFNMCGKLGVLPTLENWWKLLARQMCGEKKLAPNVNSHTAVAQTLLAHKNTSSNFMEWEFSLTPSNMGKLCAFPTPENWGKLFERLMSLLLKNVNLRLAP
jgi:hypothetical protein